MAIKLEVLCFTAFVLAFVEKSFSSPCTSEYCVADQNRLLSAAAGYQTVSACDDFKTYAMDRFLNQLVPDGVVAVGFLNDVRKSFAEKQKLVLEAPVKPNDLRIFKLLKRFFIKCSETGL